MTGVVVDGVRRTFGDVVAVDSMDLVVPAGQVTALVGPNGSGKTTRCWSRRHRSSCGPTYGLGADLAIGVAFSVVAVRRLRAPARKLPRGTRVA